MSAFLSPLHTCFTNLTSARGPKQPFDTIIIYLSSFLVAVIVCPNNLQKLFRFEVFRSFLLKLGSFNPASLYSERVTHIALALTSNVQKLK